MKHPLILHIGTPKSGTTSLQQIFSVNRQKLLESGVCYPTTFGKANLTNLALAYAAFTPGNHFFTRHKITSDADQKELRNRIHEEWEKESRRLRDTDTVVISNEHLYTRMRSIKRLKEMRDWLNQHFDPIRIFVGLRPQIDLWVSNTSQVARMGLTVDGKTFQDPTARRDHGFLNYSRGLGPWEAVFGVESLFPIPLRRHPDIVKYFCDLLGIGELKNTDAINKNPALGWKAIAVSNLLVRQLRGKPVPDPRRHARSLDLLPSSESLQVGIEIAKAVTDIFRPENEKLVKKYEMLDMSDFEPNWQNYRAPSNLHLIDAATECFDLMESVRERADF